MVQWKKPPELSRNIIDRRMTGAAPPSVQRGRAAVAAEQARMRAIQIARWEADLKKMALARWRDSRR